MEQLKKFFPLSTSCTDNETFVRNLIIYIAIFFVCTLILWAIGKIPIIGIVAWILGIIIDIYIVVGIVLAILLYFNVIK